MDVEIPSLVIVGAYREDEVPDSHPLALHIRELEQMSIEFTAINVGNLSLSNVTSLVAEALRMEDNEGAVKPLAETVHKKTDGNAFFVLLFLRSLYDGQLIQYNFGTMSWRWDDEAVKAQLATENVATMLVNKLRRLNGATQNVLKVASCLGSRISPSAMAVLTDNITPIELRRLSSSVADTSETDDDASVLDYSIHELETEGIWERDDAKDVWCFSHDKIQSAAFSLISPEKQDSFRGELGNILQKNLDPEDLEDSLFEVVSLRNCSAISDEGERRDLAKLNLRAGIKASDNAAFDSAGVYFIAGYKSLGSSGWAVDSQTMLDLCSEGSTACFVSGDLDMMNVFIMEVLSRDEIPIQDKYRVYQAKFMAAAAAGKLNDAIDCGLEFRRLLGVPFKLRNKPISIVTTLKEYIKTDHALKKMKTAEDIANLPELTDERIMMSQRMLGLLIPPVYTAQPTLFALLIFASVRSSLRFGIDANSCDAFGGYGVILW